MDELPRYDRFGERLPPARGFADYDAPPHRPGMFDDDGPYMPTRGVPPPPPPRRPGGLGPSFNDGFDSYDQLFPPPPPPRQPPGAQRGGKAGAHREEEEDDPERRAFKEELEKLAADLEKVGVGASCLVQCLRKRSGIAPAGADCHAVGAWLEA